MKTIPRLCQASFQWIRLNHLRERCDSSGDSSARFKARPGAELFFSSRSTVPETSFCSWHFCDIRKTTINVIDVIHSMQPLWNYILNSELPNRQRVPNGG